MGISIRNTINTRRTTKGIDSGCLSSLYQCPCVQSVENQCMQQKKDWEEATSGMSVASSVICATRCSTAQTAMKRTLSSTAGPAMEESLGLKDMVLVVVQVL